MMKINNMGSSGVNPYKRQINKLENISKMPSVVSDKVEISSTAKEMQHLSSYNVQRQQKVEELKTQFESGTYKVDSHKIAKSLYDFYRI